MYVNFNEANLKINVQNLYKESYKILLKMEETQVNRKAFLFLDRTSDQNVSSS